MYHPVTFSSSILHKRPYVTKIHDKNYVLWRSQGARITVLEDKCVHRCAKLSQGRIDEKGNIQCPYHGWKFDEYGACIRIPQLPSGKCIPKTCNMAVYDAFEYDGIVWMTTSPIKPEKKKGFYRCDSWTNKNKEYFVTDYEMDAPYSYELQIENLLDPAHIHYVHDGFQGNQKNASDIKVQNLKVTQDTLCATFEHSNPKVPKITISYEYPNVVDVSIHDKNMNVVRKNIIYVTPRTNKSCKVLFRDVTFKKYLTPSDNKFVKTHVDVFTNLLPKGFIDEHYDVLNSQVVRSIIDQDIDVIKGQQENVNNYLGADYVLPTSSDRLIIAFRKLMRGLHYQQL